MSVREKVARAIHGLTVKINSTVPETTFPIPPFEHGQSFWYDHADAAITTFLEAAATIPDKDGQTWRMVPVEATEEMAHTANGFDYISAHTMRQDAKLTDQYHAMLAAAPKFELDE